MLVLTKSDIQSIDGTEKLKTLVEQMRSTSALALSVAAMAQDELIARTLEEAESAKIARLEEAESSKRARLEMETLSTKFKSTVPPKVIKFNVRGTPFSTSTANLLKGVEQTYFSVLAKGQFKIELDKDDAMYIDRSPFGFQVVWNYILGDVVNLDTLSEAEREIVGEEADFYQVQSLLRILTPLPQFNTVFRGAQMSFSSNNTVAMRLAMTDNTKPSYVMSAPPFVIAERADFAVKKIKLVASPVRSVVAFGLAPAKLMSDLTLSTGNCGYWCSSHLRLYGEIVENGVIFQEGTVKQNSVLQLRLHRDKSVSIVLDGEDLGVAFRDVKTEEPLYLVATMENKGDCVELLPELF
jgi:hypothetical protein